VVTAYEKCDNVEPQRPKFLSTRIASIREAMLVRGLKLLAFTPSGGPILGVYRELWGCTPLMGVCIIPWYCRKSRGYRRAGKYDSCTTLHRKSS